ncbi:hypothetical protein [Pseudoalteromonas piscicida]|uniref:Uncharacterized protein n=1 Tax=Pseudoalteromonas piscicida TaxID=43662 RepID=A0A2A5JTZ8_PSEO7|nr:hypothetical protein [Pseudoalteromonas piscicida]PCK32952.1 hypothetical protein CEX98_05005 [Pseudoalteromonas piscicida]
MGPHQLPQINMFDKLISLFKKGDDSLNVLESEILDKVVEVLSSQYSNILKKRIKSINLVQRIDNNMEVNCFEMSNGKAILRTEHRLINDSGEAVLATFAINKDSMEPVSGKLWLVQGVFFSIEFDSPPNNLTEKPNYSISISLADCFKTKSGTEPN